MTDITITPAQIARWVENLAEALDGTHADAYEYGLIRNTLTDLRGLLPGPACPNCGHLDSLHGPDGTACWISGCDCPFPAATLPALRTLLAAQADAKPTPAIPSADEIARAIGDPGSVVVSRVHTSFGDETGETITRWSTRAVLALLGTKPTAAEPRVWREGDPEPAGVTEVRDSDDTAIWRNWRRDPDGLWRTIGARGRVDPDARGRTWGGLAAHYGPLTEVLPGGAR